MSTIVSMRCLTQSLVKNEVSYPNYPSFEKQVGLLEKRGYDMNKLRKVIHILQSTGILPNQYRPHKLKGDYAGYWECHIQPDWLLIWQQNDNKLIMIMTNTGTHAELF